ncbi:MAG: heavy metal-associated domain-containing protein, partial [Dehalococcoidales bacterium]|nr:heavy metal-associated domain-containing protein [Dehalococcoidales bacterium]
PSVTTGVPEGARLVRVDLPLERLDCPECSKSVQQALAALPGVQRAFVSAESGRATVVYDRARVGLPQMGEAVRQAGYLPLHCRQLAAFRRFGAACSGVTGGGAELGADLSAQAFHVFDLGQQFRFAFPREQKPARRHLDHSPLLFP